MLKQWTIEDERGALATALRRCDKDIACARRSGREATVAALEVQRAVLLGNWKQLGQGEDKGKLI